MLIYGQDQNLYFIQIRESLSDLELDRLSRLLNATPTTVKDLKVVMPRPGTISP